MTRNTITMGVQMDAPERADPASDTSIAMIRSASERGWTVLVWQPSDLWWEQGRVLARARRLVAGDGLSWSQPERIDVGGDTDMVLMRQDPPVDELYLTATYLLELAGSETLVCNDPKGVRDSPEKMLPLHFAELMPPTLICRELEQIADFRARHGSIVLKPLHGHGGRNVFLLRPDDGNFRALVEMFRNDSGVPFIAQAFLPAVEQGDKRILLVDGKPCGAINRRPPQGGIRSNMVVGGKAEATVLSERESEICACLGPELRRRGLLFVGIDVIGEMMTEINVTSPTGAQAVRQLSGLDPVRSLLDLLEARLKRST